MSKPKVHILKPLGCAARTITARQLWSALSNGRKAVLVINSIMALSGGVERLVFSTRKVLPLGLRPKWRPLAFGRHALRMGPGPFSFIISRDSNQCGSSLYGIRLSLLGECTLGLSHFLFGGQYEERNGDHDGSVGKELHKSWSVSKSRQSAATKARRIGSWAGILRSAQHIGWLISVRKATCDAYAYTCESFLTTFWPARRSRAGWRWYEFGFLSNTPCVPGGPAAKDELGPLYLKGEMV